MYALPHSLADAEIAQMSEIASLHQQNATRDVAWLEANGRCLDNIVQGKSTLENAGHGAFAKRPLPEGTIISGSPLHHMLRSLLDMYEGETDDTTEAWVRKDKKGHQLLLNYCYGHAKSNLLLCPYSSGVNYINHNQTLANVEIRWAPDGMVSQNNSWFSLAPKEMEWNYSPNLAFDFIATKDISEGEELFLDYGRDWEEAWQKHVKQWKPKEEWFDHIDAATWNQYHAKKTLRTESEQQKEPYPENLSVQCHSTLVADETMDESLPLVFWEFDWAVSEMGFPCLIMDRHDDEGLVTYDVIIEARDDAGVSTEVVRGGVPREAISFLDRPYTTDMHLDSAFRHEIQISDDIFPSLWKDRILEKAQAHTMFFASEVTTGE